MERGWDQLVLRGWDRTAGRLVRITFVRAGVFCARVVQGSPPNLSIICSPLLPFKNIAYEIHFELLTLTP